MARKGRQQTRRPRRGLSRKALVGLATVLAVLAAGALILVSTRAAVAPPILERPGLPGEGSTKGRPDAPVAVVEYSDFQCPFCAQFALGTFPRLEEAYVRAGQVHWTFRHFAFLGPESLWAAEAAECAGEQGRFWPYHDKLFASQSGEGKGAFSRANLKKLAREVGLDGGSFDACLDAGRYTRKVQQDIEDGRRQGVRATPTFFVAGRKLEGAQPYAAFQSALEEALQGRR